MLGVNLSGAEFGAVGGRYGYDYIYPGADQIQYYADRGVELIRLPVKWERLQPSANGALDPAELGRLREFLQNADASGVKVIVDLHNYGFYYNNQIGTAGLPDSQFAGFWQKLAQAIGNEPALAGYDLMNEPHDLPDAHAWPDAAQAAVNAIRTVDVTHNIYVEGESYANAANWSAINPNLDIHDPVNKVVYSAHLYFDRYQSGTYQGSYDQEGANPDLGAQRIADFVQWLEDHNAKGLIGETAVPDSDPRWLTVFSNYLTAANEAGLDTTVWGGGPWWGDYPLALRNADGSESAQ
ncbi:MAG: glycoside hydrolase family 5 protein, partial [Sphingomonadales bacterium]